MQREYGVSLIELVTALIVLSFVIMVGVPALASLVERHRAWEMQHRLHSALLQSRLHAMNNNVQVRVCRSADGQTCGGDGDWTSGWLAFEAGAGIGNCVVDSDTGFCEHGGRLLRTESGIGRSGMYIVDNNNVAKQVRFTSLGEAKGHNGRFTVCSRDHRPLRGLVIAFSGRIRTADATELLSCGT